MGAVMQQVGNDEKEYSSGVAACERVGAGTAVAKLDG